MTAITAVESEPAIWNSSPIPSLIQVITGKSTHPKMQIVEGIISVIFFEHHVNKMSSTGQCSAFFKSPCGVSYSEFPRAMPLAAEQQVAEICYRLTSPQQRRTIGFQAH